MSKRMSNLEKFIYVGKPVSDKGGVMRHIEAVKTFVCGGVEIKAGTQGGCIREGTLSQKGTAWVFKGATVKGDSMVEEHAAVMGGAVVDSNISGKAVVSGEDSYVSAGSNICGEVHMENCTVESSSVAGNLYYSGEFISNRRIFAREYKTEPVQSYARGTKICGGFVNPNFNGDRGART